jgi:hypothetical protein
MRGVKNVEFALREIPIQHPPMLPEAATMGRPGSAESRFRTASGNFCFRAQHRAHERLIAGFLACGFRASLRQYLS